MRVFNLKKNEKRLLDLMDFLGSGSMNCAQLSKAMHWDERTTQRYLDLAYAAKYIDFRKVESRGHGGESKHYYLTGGGKVAFGYAKALHLPMPATLGNMVPTEANSRLEAMTKFEEAMKTDFWPTFKKRSDAHKKPD